MKPVPARSLPAQPSLRHLKDQAADLRRAFAYREPAAMERVRVVVPPDALPERELMVSTALLAIAREYGFSSWPALKQDLEGRAEHKEKEQMSQLNGEIESIKQRIRRAAADDHTTPGYLANILAGLERIESPECTAEDFERVKADLGGDLGDLVVPPGPGGRVNWKKVGAQVDDYLEVAARVTGRGWWSGFGAVKTLRSIAGFDGLPALDALQSLDNYVVRLAPLSAEHGPVVAAIESSRARIAIAVGKALEAAGKAVLAKSETTDGARLALEATALRREAADLLPAIHGRIEDVKRLGKPLETLKPMG